MKGPTWHSSAIAFGKEKVLELLRWKPDIFNKIGFFRTAQETIVAAIEYSKLIAKTSSPEDCRYNAKRFNNFEFRRSFLSAACADINSIGRDEKRLPFLEQRFSIPTPATKE